MTRSRVCLLVGLAGFAVAFRSAPQVGYASERDRPTEGVRYVKIPAGAAAKAATMNVRPDFREDYGAFVWQELSPGEFTKLKASGVAYEEVTNAFEIVLGDTRFDPVRAQPRSTTEWTTAGGDGPDFQLVQFRGPVRSEWVDQLKAQGLEVVQYIHPNTYIVWGDRAVRDRAATKARAVRWSGDFLPAYRVLPRFRESRASRGQVRVMLYRGADTQAAIRKLQALGAKLDGTRTIDDVFEQATFEMPTSSFLSASRVPGVYSIKAAPTDGGLRGEMSDQVCVNNVDLTNLAFPGYEAWLASVGLSGAGVIMANVDGGVLDTHPCLVNRMLPCTGQTCGGSTSSGHGTHTAGIMAADGSSGVLDGYGFLRGLGVAPGAHLVEQVYSPWYQQDGGMLLLMTDSYNNGASLSSNSWGPSGSAQGYDDDTRQVDVGVRDADPNTPGNQPLSYILSIMNGGGGTSSQGTPDEAKNIFSVGSTKMQTYLGEQFLDINNLSSNSAHGPCLDGRKLPHIVAPGCYVDSTDLSDGYNYRCGTSMSSPHVSGAVALFIEYYRNLPTSPPDPSPALIKAAFLPVAHDLAGNLDADGVEMGHPFDSKQGWGRLNLEAVVDPQVSVLYFDNPVIFDGTGEEWTRQVSVADPALPLKIMLVWTDAPGHGLGGSTPAWNNDLDLIVEAGSDVYRGNVFGADGWSVTGGAADDRNNTEGVFIGPMASGDYTIRVVAGNINSDGIPNDGDATDQDFALVCYNGAQEPDFSLVASPSQQSICAPADAVYAVDVGSVMGYSEPVTLSAVGQPTGTTVSFDVNPVTPPGVSTMTIGHTGAAAPGAYTIEISGVSESSAHDTIVRLHLYNGVPTAPTLLTPTDGVTGVAVQPTLTWSAASQAAEYDVAVATDASFTEIVASATVVDTSYAVAPALDPDTLYYWHVRGRNECGDGDFSAPFSFRTLDVPPILLVDDDDNNPNVRTFYTSALDAIGAGYDVWDTNNSDNEPTAAQLAPYKIVIWFTGDEFGGACGPGAAAETALATWLEEGNCLFISSQDYHYDRGLTSFMTDYLGVASVDNDVTQTTVTGAGSVFTGFGPYTLSYSYSNYSDRVTASASAEQAFSGNQGSAAVDKDNGVYRTTYWGFSWEAVPEAGRVALLAHILDWCGGPEPDCPTVIGDVDGDNDVDGDDIAGFVDCFLAGDPFAAGCGCADVNANGSFEMDDITLFVECLLVGGCP